jgi:hypothetical protein
VQELTRSRGRRSVTRLDLDMVQGRAAIELVACGVARRVRLSGLTYAERIAATLAASAQQAGVAFRLEHDDTGTSSLVVGPRITPRSAT